MSDAAFSAWANAVSEAIANGDCSVEDGDWVWPPPEPWLSTIAPELEFFNLWCQSRFGTDGITISSRAGEVRFFSCLDPSDFFAETKTDKELVELLTNRHEYIRAAARNAFLKRRPNVRTVDR